MSKIFTITPYKIQLCCQIFYHSWLNFKRDIPEYAQTMRLLSNNEGIILCPDCLMEKINEQTDR